MRIKFVYFLLLVLFPASVYSQNNIHEKRIYLLDVTKSMVGKGVVETPDIFEQVKQNLIEAINEIEDPQTEIVVVPFTNTSHEIISGFVSQKDSLSRVLASLTVRNGDTNIADAWAMGVSLLDSTKVNYMFLLTDGLHNNGPSQDSLYSLLRDWDTVRKGKYFFCFLCNAHQQRRRTKHSRHCRSNTADVECAIAEYQSGSDSYNVGSALQYIRE